MGEDRDAIPGFARKLAHSSSRRTRERGMAALAAWLAGVGGAGAGASEMRRVWKGLFYMMWHADRAKTQGQLAESLGALVSELPAKQSQSYFEAFLVTMRREWHGIDKLRLDKYYSLVRACVRHALRACRADGWSAEARERYLPVLHDCINANRRTGTAATTLSVGLPMHVADVYLAELCGACATQCGKAKPNKPLPAEALLELLEPFFAAVGGGLADTRVVGRVAEAVFCGMLNLGKEALAVAAGGTDAADATVGAALVAPPESVRAVKAAIFKRAGSEDTGRRCAELLYNLHSMYEAWERNELGAGAGGQGGEEDGMGTEAASDEDGEDGEGADESEDEEDDDYVDLDEANAGVGGAEVEASEEEEEEEAQRVARAVEEEEEEDDEVTVTPRHGDRSMNAKGRKLERRRARMAERQAAKQEFVAVPFGDDGEADVATAAEEETRPKKAARLSRRAAKAAARAETGSAKKAKKATKAAGAAMVTPPPAAQDKGKARSETPKSGGGEANGVGEGVRTPKSALKKTGSYMDPSPKKKRVKFELARNEVNEFPMVRGERSVCEPNMVQAMHVQMERMSKMQRKQQQGRSGGLGVRRGGVAKRGSKANGGGNKKKGRGGRARASDFF
eukprot:PRCOL_00002161-RA